MRSPAPVRDFGASPPTTKASRAGRSISGRFFETLLAIGVFWWVALKWETFFLLYTSLLIAPLLFLRSPKSVAQGVEWFDNGFFPTKSPEDPEARAAVVKQLAKSSIWIAIALGVCVVTGYLAIKVILVSFEGLGGFWRRVVFGYFLVNWTVAGLLAFILALEGLGFSRIAEGLTEARLEKLREAGRLKEAEALLRVVALTETGALKRAIEGGVALILPGLMLAMLIYSQITRFCATLRFLIEGYAAMPTNIRRLSLFTAPGHVPELIPGLPKEHKLRLGAVIAEGKEALASSEFSNWVFGFFLLPLVLIWFLPGWAYRFILKSTLWFWWILFIVGGAPNVEDGIEGLRADAYRKAHTWIFIALAVFGVAGFLFGAELKPMIANRLSDAPLLSTAAMLLLIEWRAISAFQWVVLLSSGLTLGVVFWTHSLVVDYKEVPGRKESVEKRLPWLGSLVKWKTAIGMASIALLMLYILLYANRAEHWAPVSDWAFGWLQSLYGENARALLPPR